MTGLSIRKLYKAYGSFMAVHGIDLEIPEGELVVLLGPSGCGKTTTLRCVAGLEDISDGTIAIGDTVVSQRGRSLPPERRQIGMVFQSYAIWPHMTVAENVAFGLKLQRMPKTDTEARVRSALDLVGLSGYAERHVSQLSGGQQQRVALARAMALEPRILLFDEPLSNLDAKLRERMRFELRQIQQRLGITSVYVTHDQQEAMVIADRIVLMRNGHIEQMGTPELLYHKPRTRFAAEFVGLANIFEGEARNGEVKIDGGPILKSADLTSGPVEIIFRPEQVRVTSGQPSDGPNVFEAQVKESFFLGNIEDLVLNAEGAEIRTQLSPAAHHKTGSTLWLTIPPEAIVLLPRATSSQQAA